MHADEGWTVIQRRHDGHVEFLPGLDRLQAGLRGPGYRILAGSADTIPTDVAEEVPAEGGAAGLGGALAPCHLRHLHHRR